MKSRPLLRLVCGLAAAVIAASHPAVAQPSPPGRLVAVLSADMQILDPMVTAAAPSRTFGYLVWDTLFALDTNGAVQPQMVDRWTRSADGLTWTFHLRDGLTFSDSSPVTAEDCIASLQRWMTLDTAMGRRLAAATARLVAIDDRSFAVHLKAPFELLLDALAQPLGPLPVIMPASLIKADGLKPVSTIVGSGPFTFRRSSWIPGAQLQFDRNPTYRPRPEAADFLSGGKLAGVEGVDIRIIADESTAMNALRAGEADFVENASYDLLAAIKNNPNIKSTSPAGPSMWTGLFVLNHAAKPFDDPAIRQVLWQAIDQREMMQALGMPEGAALDHCPSFFSCGTPLANNAGAGIAARPSVAAAQAALRRTAYAGEPVIIMQANDVPSLRVSAEVLADLLRKVGFRVDLQTMDLGTMFSRRNRLDGWSVYGTAVMGYNLRSPLTNFFIARNCASTPGAPCDPEINGLLDRFAQTPALEGQRLLAAQIQERVYINTPAVLWGQYSRPIAYSARLRGIIPSAVTVFWNITKH